MVSLFHMWRLALAWFRLSPSAVCEMSAGRDLHNDFHDYPDGEAGEPWHMYTHRCRRCGKEFTI
jgi:hypothetical protein